jgi:hypothetical protein
MSVVQLLIVWMLIVPTSAAAGWIAIQALLIRWRLSEAATPSVLERIRREGST